MSVTCDRVSEAAAEAVQSPGLVANAAADAAVAGTDDDVGNNRRWSRRVDRRRRRYKSQSAPGKLIKVVRRPAKR
jgi:hypothetical protein